MNYKLNESMDYGGFCILEKKTTTCFYARILLKLVGIRRTHMSNKLFMGFAKSVAIHTKKFPLREFP